MKKIFILVIGTALSASVASAATLETVLEGMGASMSVSSGVLGTYFSGDADGNFVLSTKNSKGTKAYATSSTVTKIYYTECAAIPCGTVEADDLLDTAPTTDASATTMIEGFGTVLGEAAAAGS